MSDDMTIHVVIDDDGSIMIEIEDDHDSPILPCLCCGGKAMMNIASEMWIECQKCHLRTACGDDAEECLAEWNRRTHR